MIVQSEHIGAWASGSDVVKTEVCFTVHNPGGVVLPGGPALPADPVARRVIGERFQAPGSDPTRVIVLVHGHGWWQNEWDLRPDFSIARNLARKGFLVISYDRLGNGASTYALPQRETLTFGGQRTMLHEVIEQLRGTSVRRGNEPNPCAGVRPAGVGANPKVILVGHSQGALLVNGYPGQYGPADPGHIDALLEDGNGGCAPGAPCPIPGLGARAHEIVARDLSTNFGRDFNLGFTAGSYDPYLAWQPKVKYIDPANCIEATFGQLWPEATSADALVNEACNPPNHETVPYNEFVSTSALTDNLPAVDPHLPVLLTFADHDGLHPDRANPDDAPCNADPNHDVGCRQPFVDKWRSACPCGPHVTEWTLRNAGHSIALDLSMPSFTDKVASWLGEQALGPNRSQKHRSVKAGAGPPGEVWPWRGGCRPCQRRPLSTASSLPTATLTACSAAK